MSSLRWTDCPVCRGMGVQFAVESVSSLAWNTQVAPLKRQKEANLKGLIGDDLLVWDGKLDTDIPSLDELTEAVGDLLTAELERLDEIPKQSSEEDDDEVIEQPKKGKGGGGKAVKPGKGGKGAKGGKQGRGGKGGKDKL